MSDSSQEITNNSEVIIFNQNTQEGMDTTQNSQQGNRSSVSPQPENEEKSIAKQIQDHLSNEFANIQSKLGDQILGIRDEMEHRFQNFQIDLHEVRQDSQQLRDQVNGRKQPNRIQAPNLLDNDFPPQNLQPNTFAPQMGILHSPMHRSNTMNVSGSGDQNGIPIPTTHSTPHMNRNHNMGSTFSQNPTKGNAKPRRYDGTDDLDDYISQFEIISDLNNWDYKTKSLQLASQLAGQACGILGELTEVQRRDYKSLLQALQMRFGSIERSELFRAKLKTKTKGEKETLSELAQSVKKLTRQAYPRADPYMTGTLALDHFIDALPDREMKLRIREAHPKNIEEAEMLAIRLETYKLADQPNTASVHAITKTDQNSNINGQILSCLRDIKESLDSNFSKLQKGINIIQHQTKPQRINQNRNNRFQYNQNRNYNQNRDHNQNRQYNQNRDNYPNRDHYPNRGNYPNQNHYPNQGQLQNRDASQNEADQNLPQQTNSQNTDSAQTHANTPQGNLGMSGSGIGTRQH